MAIWFIWNSSLYVVSLIYRLNQSKVYIWRILCTFVTGTKGKTTTTFMIKEILEAQGKKVGLIGTVANYICGKNLGESSRTTPDSLELQKLFSDMVEAGAEYAIMEVSSQALKVGRVEGLSFDYGVFTNLTKDLLKGMLKERDGISGSLLILLVTLMIQKL